MPPQVNPLRGVLPYAEFPNGGEPITKEPDTKSGSLAKNGLTRENKVKSSMKEEEKMEFIVINRIFLQLCPLTDGQ